MAGIVGVIHLEGAPVAPAELERLAGPIAHRGRLIPASCPDRAVALVSLSRAGDAPAGPRGAAPPAEGLPLVADLRLHSRRELLGLLADEPTPPHPHAPDSELLAAACAAWGDGAAERLLGDFAFAFWDARRRRLFCARDLMGMRPLYYTLARGAFWFASEVKALLAIEGLPRRVEPLSIAAWLNETSSPLELTFYEGIRQLPPGHALALEAGRVRVWPWWRFEPARRIRHRRVEDYVEHFRQLLLEAVESCLAGDARASLLLSGGLDSGSVAAAAGWLAAQGRLPRPPLHAISWAFDRMPLCDERHLSDQVVRHGALPLSLLDADDGWPLADYPAIAPDADDPILGAYQGLLEQSMAIARARGDRVVMTGHRGDLLVGGWISDLPGMLLAGHWRTLAREVAAIRNHQVPYPVIVKTLLLHPLLQTLWHQPSAASLRQWLAGALGRRDPAAGRAGWLRPDFARASGLDDLLRQPPPRPDLRPHARRERYRMIFLPAQMRITNWLGRLAARHGLTSADVWSDRRLVEFVLSIPQHLVHRQAEDKWLTREAMRGVMPESIRTQCRKILPTPIFQQSMARHARPIALELLTRPRLAELGWVDPDRLRRDYDAFCLGQTDDQRFWGALTAEAWLRLHGP